MYKQGVGEFKYFVGIDSLAGPTEVVIMADRRRRLLAPQSVGRLDGNELERRILDSPGTWAFRASQDAQGWIAVTADGQLERLHLGSLPDSAVAAFTAARELFFDGIRKGWGSVYAVGAGAMRSEAERYVDSYLQLLESVPEGARYQPEFDRLLLIDSVAVAGSLVRFIAPTNPLTLAHLSFAFLLRPIPGDTPRGSPRSRLVLPSSQPQLVGRSLPPDPPRCAGLPPR